MRLFFDRVQPAADSFTRLETPVVLRANICYFPFASSRRHQRARREKPHIRPGGVETFHVTRTQPLSPGRARAGKATGVCPSEFGGGHTHRLPPLLCGRHQKVKLAGTRLKPIPPDFDFLTPEYPETFLADT
jgi:hypothetical protein